MASNKCPSDVVQKAKRLNSFTKSWKLVSLVSLQVDGCKNLTKPNFMKQATLQEIFKKASKHSTHLGTATQSSSTSPFPIHDVTKPELHLGKPPYTSAPASTMDEMQELPPTSRVTSTLTVPDANRSTSSST